MIFTTKFEIKDKVKIIPLENCDGIILNIYYKNGIEYFVRYFHEGKINEVYFYEDELTGGKQ